MNPVNIDDTFKLLGRTALYNYHGRVGLYVNNGQYYLGLEDDSHSSDRAVKISAEMALLIKKEILGDKCARCGKFGDDRRTLQMAGMVDMSQLGIPFESVKGYYTICVCKKCRGTWMVSLQEWFSLGND